MGIVASRAFPLANGLVHLPAADLSGQLVMTRVAEILHLLLEQWFIPRRMGHVAGKAFPRGRRLMFHFFLECVTVMAGETIHLRTGVRPLMAVRAIALCKRRMLLRVKKILVRAAMGIMTGNTGICPRLDLLVGGEKIRIALIVTFGAEFADGFLGHRLMVGAMGTVAGGAIIGRRWVQCSVSPVLGHLAVTLKAEGRLSLLQIAGMG